MFLVFFLILQPPPPLDAMHKDLFIFLQYNARSKQFHKRHEMFLHFVFVRIQIIHVCNNDNNGRKRKNGRQ